MSSGATNGANVDPPAIGNYRCRMRIVASALKHGIAETAILHAVEHYLRVYDDQGEVAILIGPDPSGIILEIGVVIDDDGDDPRVIHAMKARPKYWP